MDHGRCWLAAYTRSRHENQVASQLSCKGVESLLPTFAKLSRWSDRIKRSQAPLFPGYVFVRVARQEQLQVLKVAGAVRFVCANGHPVPLPDEEMESLMNATARGVRTEPHPYLTAGRRVRVRYGPLAEARGILVRRKDKFRIVVSLDLLMRSVGVEVDESDVEPY